MHVILPFVLLFLSVFLAALELVVGLSVCCCCTVPLTVSFTVVSRLSLALFSGIVPADNNTRPGARHPTAPHGQTNPPKPLACRRHILLHIPKRVSIVGCLPLPISPTQDLLPLDSRSTFVVVEYVEERPPLLGSTGMASSIITFVRNSSRRPPMGTAAEVSKTRAR